MWASALKSSYALRLGVRLVRLHLCLLAFSTSAPQYSQTHSSCNSEPILELTREF
ncbi:MAG: hypothetical protein MR964_01860 [Campylobacter sp.]|uniref:hypothetical protein n=1 Tax=Campylobacter sp. TaxID=205 RepID=UPI002AA7090E|nr:hypothetical protein [Campylobacter sp.]MCI7022969.1 hypothetical protein [Campylobacter sp.]